MMDTDEYFPRGGKKPIKGYFKQPGNFLGAPDSNDKKKKKQRKKRPEGDESFLSGEVDQEFEMSHINCAAGLSHMTIREGMLILGRIYHITGTTLHVSLPNRRRGVVMACHICEAYNKLLEAYVNDQVESVRELKAMFHLGQYVATRVLEGDGGGNVMLSMMPQHVHADLQHSDLVKGTLLQAAVSSVEDHGFVMDVGIQNTRAFLPKDKTEEGIELDEGTLIWCIVTSSSLSPALCTVKLTSQLAALQNAICRQSNKLNALTPGTAVQFTVDKALDNGIEGRIFDNTTAYIQRAHTDVVKGKKPKLAQSIKARLLYQLPTRKVPFLIMKNVFESLTPDLNEEQRYKVGDFIENAQVINITKRTVVMKLGKREMGMMSLKNISADEDLEEHQVIAKSYPLGSEHTVRILDYNLSDYNYVVSDQRELLTEKYFRLDDLSVGETVNASVAAVSDNWVILHVGRVQGLAPIAHVTDSGVYSHPKGSTTSKLAQHKYKVGSKVQARVLSIDPEGSGLFLTMKPTLIAATNILDTYHEAAVGKNFTGVIACIKEYLLVTFFNTVTAFVPKMFVSKEPIVNLADSFHIGQIVNCTITNFYSDSKQYRGSLTTPPFDPSKPRNKNTEYNERKRRNTSETSNDNPHEKDFETAVKKRKKHSDTIDNSKDTETETQEKKRKKAIDNTTDTETKEPKSKKREQPIDNMNEKEEKKLKKKKKDGTENSELDEDNIKKESSEKNKTRLSKEDRIKAHAEYLMDLSFCDTRKRCTRRIVLIARAINAGISESDNIEYKMSKMERNGLNRENQKDYDLMQAEVSAIQNRVMKWTESLKKVQEMLKTYPEVEKNKDKIQNGDVPSGPIANGVVQSSAVTKEVKDPIRETLKERVKQIKVADTTTALALPSIKEFWSAEVKLKAEAKAVDELSSSEDEEKEQPKKKRKKLSDAEKVSKAREEEEKLRSAELSALDGAPQSATQFERALLAEPDNSRLWLSYIALHLQSTEIEKARAVCRRALKTINFREEDEKFNIWIAMVNMEHRFGTEETQQKTLDEALQMNDPYKVHTKLLDILVDLNKTIELASLVDKMVRKYKRQGENYIQCGRACYQLKMVDKARQVMQKAVAVLDKKEHITVLVQFALLERAHGDRDRAEALFEQILGVYPQRVDVCSAYIDMLYKAGDYEQIRQVMERMTSQKLPARKMKVLYKKWIEVEEKIGDESQVERIRVKAMEFIDNAKF